MRGGSGSEIDARIQVKEAQERVEEEQDARLMVERELLAAQV